MVVAGKEVVEPLQVKANDMRVLGVVADPEGVKTPSRLKIDATAPAGASFEHGQRMPRPNPVYQPIEPLEVANLGNALPVGLIVRCPVGERIDVEIVPDIPDAEFPNVAIEKRANPLFDLGPAVIEKAVAAVGQPDHPVGVLLGQERVFVDTLRLEP